MAEVIVYYPERKPGVRDPGYIEGGIVRELVRCKDCKHGEKSPTFRYYPNLSWCNKYERSHEDDWFCADGERKIK